VTKFERDRSINAVILMYFVFQDGDRRHLGFRVTLKFLPPSDRILLLSFPCKFDFV
jgi:hypothetical protein